MSKQPLTAEQVKTNLRAQGLTVKAWAEQNNFDYDTVSKVIQGVRKGNYGRGHKIAVALGLKATPVEHA